MVYHTRNHTLHISEKKEIDLTPLEHKFLIAISDNNTTSLETISNYVYGYCDFQGIREIKTTLLKKVNLKIKTIIGTGYRLETKILFK